MHMKAAAILAGALSVASAATVDYSQTHGQEPTNVHRQFQVGNKVCVTKTKVQFCNADFQPVYEQNSERTVEMYCLDKHHPQADKMSHIMENGHRLQSMINEAETLRAQIPKVKRCKNIRLTKQGEVEDFTTEEYQRTAATFEKFQTKQEQEQKYHQVREQQREKQQQLKKLMPTIQQAVKLSESEYEQAFELIKKIARKDEQVEGLLYHLQSTLPSTFTEAVQRVQGELIQDSMNEQEQKQIKEQLKQLAQRVYIYTLSRLNSEQQKQPIREQIEQEYTQWDQFEEQFERVWEQLKNEMDSDKIEKIERQAQRKFKQQIQEDEQKQLQSWQLSLQESQKEQQQREKQGQWWQQWEQQQPQEWEQEMTPQQRERQQMLLTKIVMAGLKAAEQQQKQQQQSGSFMSFGKKVNYEQLVQNARRLNSDF